MAAGVARVVVRLRDPLERDRAQGVEVLRAAGIEVAVAEGDEARACAELNVAVPDLRRSPACPQVTLKLATSLDGKIATATGESRWISGPASRALVHRWRADSDAVAVGIGTALADDPRLTARDVRGPGAPARPRGLRLGGPPAARLGPRAPARELPVIVLAGEDAPADARRGPRRPGVEVVPLRRQPRDERIGAGAARARRRAGIQSLFVEGGAGLAAGAAAAGAVDRVAWFLAPILIGGRDGRRRPSAGPGRPALADAPRLIAPAPRARGRRPARHRAPAAAGRGGAA